MNDPETIADTGLKCPECGYNLTAVNTNRCPECGTPFHVARGVDLPTPEQRSYAQWESVLAVVICSGVLVTVWSAQGTIQVTVSVVSFVIAMMVLIGLFTWPFVAMRRCARKCGVALNDGIEADPPLPFEVMVSYSPDLHAQYNRRTILPRYRSWIVGSLSAIAICGGLLVAIEVYWFVYVALGIALTFLYGIWQQLRGTSPSAFEQSDERFVFGEDGISWIDEDGIYQRRWSAITEVEQHPEMWIVHFRSGATLMFPTMTTPPDVFKTIKQYAPHAIRGTKNE